MSALDAATPARVPCTRLPWNGHMVEVHPDGTLALVVAGRPAHTARVVLAQWSASPSVVEHDTVTQRFVRGGATATVQHTLAAVWHLTVVIEPDPGAGPLPAAVLPRLELDGDDPARPVWLLGNGALGHALVPLPAGGLLHWRRLTGDCDVVDGQPAGPGDPRHALRLFAPTTAGSPRQDARWRAELIDHRDAGGLLPTWLPASTVVDAGEELDFDLPDAAVTSSAAAVGEVGHRTIVPVPAGRQQVSVAEAGGTVRLEVVGVRGLADELAHRVQTIVHGVDVRRASGVHLWLAVHARGAVDVEQFVVDAAEEVASATSRSQAADPFAVAALAMLSGLGGSGAGDLLDAAVGAVSRWRAVGDGFPPAGAHLASAWTSLAAAQRGIRAPDELPDPGGTGLDALEHAIVSGGDPHAPDLALRWLDALGPGLPGVPVHEDTSLRAAALLRLVPEAWWWDRTPARLAGHLSHWERRMRAAGGSDTDRWLAWLLW